MAAAKKKASTPAKRKTRVMTKKTSTSANKKLSFNASAISTYLVVFTVFLCVLAAGVAKIYLTNQKDDYLRKSDALRKELGIAEKERQNLMSQQEELMRGEVILPKASARGLHPPAPGTVRQMPPSTNFKKLKEIVSENNE